MEFVSDVLLIVTVFVTVLIGGTAMDNCRRTMIATPNEKLNDVIQSKIMADKKNYW